MQDGKVKSFTMKIVPTENRINWNCSAIIHTVVVFRCDPNTQTAAFAEKFLAKWGESRAFPPNFRFPFARNRFCEEMDGLGYGSLFNSTNCRDINAYS